MGREEEMADDVDDEVPEADEPRLSSLTQVCFCKYKGSV